MKLYYMPAACSLASHIALHEIGATFEVEKVDTKTQKTASGADFQVINRKGYVPALRLDNDVILTEGPAILQYIADQNPAAGLLPKAGSVERAQVQSHLNYIGSELHKAFGPLFSPDLSAEARAAAVALVGRKMAFIETELADGRAYLMGDTFTVADAYLFTVAGWGKYVGVDIAPLATLSAYLGRIAARPAVQEALKAEGLLK